MGSMKWGMSLVVGMECMVGVGGVSSLFDGMCSVKALRLLCNVSVVVALAVSYWECIVGQRRSRWSRGEAVGLKVGVCGFPT